MKEAISATWIIGLVTIFIFIFSGYLAVTISYSKTFKIKDEMLTIIEKHSGMTSNTGVSIKSKIKTSEDVTANLGSLQIISVYLYGMEYDSLGKCPLKGDWYSVVDLGVSLSGKVKPTYFKNYNSKTSKAYYCFRRVNVTGTKYMYYDVKLFYKLNLPVLGDLFTFDVSGSTKRIEFIDQSLI